MSKFVKISELVGKDVEVRIRHAFGTAVARGVVKPTSIGWDVGENATYFTDDVELYADDGAYYMRAE